MTFAKMCSMQNKSNWPTDCLSAKACMLILQFKHVSFEPPLCFGIRKAGRIWHHDLTELFYWDCNLTADMLIFKTLFIGSCVSIWCARTNKNLQLFFLLNDQGDIFIFCNYVITVVSYKINNNSQYKGDQYEFWSSINR